MSSSSPTLYFQLHQTAEAFVRSFDHERLAEGTATISTTLTSTCEHEIGPSSTRERLSIDQFPASNKDIEEQVASVLKFISTYSLELKDITVDEIQRKAVVQAVHHVSMKAEHGGDNCALETFFTLWMTSDGTMIVKVHQFVDSLSATKFFDDQQWVSRRAEERDPG